MNHSPEPSTRGRSPYLLPITVSGSLLVVSTLAVAVATDSLALTVFAVLALFLVTAVLTGALLWAAGEQSDPADDSPSAGTEQFGER
jgi:hypothetical protein